ncbi:ATP-dependent helicase, partial [Streptosporangium canum]
MLVVHGAWVDGRLGVWAEDTARAPAPASRATLRPHPFAAPAAVLAAALGAAVPGGAPAEAAPGAAVRGVSAGTGEGELTILLPGSTGGPLPSPESGLASSARSPRISAWRVPALLLRPVDALSLLASLSVPDAGAGPSGLGSDDVPGSAAELGWGPGLSLRYFAVVAEHARGLVRRGRILPRLVVEGDGHAARWRPVLTGADATVLRDLAAAMPPVCRAVAEERPSADVLRTALNGLVDGVARLSLPDRLILGNRPRTKAPLPDRWLYALTGEDAALPAARPAEAAALSGAL